MAQEKARNSVALQRGGSCVALRIESEENEEKGWGMKEQQKVN
jgi:hypothetical protein